MAFKVIKYQMPDGTKKEVMEHESMVPDRLKKLEWAHLKVLEIVDKRST